GAGVWLPLRADEKSERRAIQTIISRLAEREAQRVQAPLILRRRADGDANPLAKLVAAHRADDHALLLHYFERALAVADADEDEIRGGGNELQFQLAERVRQELQAPRVVFARALHVRRVVERGERAGLGDGVDVKGLAHCLERRDEIGMRDAVAEPQPRQAEDF